MTNFKSKKRYLRLLPGVVLACGGLMVLNASGLIHDAFALDAQPAQADAMTPAAKAVNQDFAGDDAQIGSASEVDVLTSLSKRRAALDAREAEVQSQSAILTATEARVDSKIAQLKALQTQIAALLVQRDAAQEKQVAALMKTYSAMKPKDAARIFDSLDESVLLPVAQELKSDTLAPILAAMDPAAAQKLTMKLADKLALPDMAPALAAAAPAPAAPAAAPAAASAAPAPQTQAAAPAPAPKPKS